MVERNNIAIKRISPGLMFGIIYSICAAYISIHSVNLGVNEFWGGKYTYYNNYVIFKNSFYHLIENRNLYTLYLNEHADYFKYSPTFALLMGVFSPFKDSIGLLLWNLLNCSLLAYGISQLTGIPEKHKKYLYLFILPELILSTQYSQCNALIAALILITYNLLERDKVIIAMLLLAISVYIKLFTILFIPIIFFYVNWKKSISGFIVFMILLFVLPIPFIGFDNMIWQYQNWFNLLGEDHYASTGWSIFQYAGLINLNKLITLMIGIIILILPFFLSRSNYKPKLRLTFVAAFLIWSVVFNHRAENPTFIIAMLGCGIWGFANNVIFKWKIVLLIPTFVFTSLIFTDLLPKSYRQDFNLQMIKPFFPAIIMLVSLSRILRRKPLSDKAPSQ